MGQRRSQQRPIREPIRSPWVWITMAVIILAGTPLYLPQGTVFSLVLGVPYWVAISVAFTVVFSAFVSWLCMNWWNIAEPEEERARAREHETSGRPEGVDPAHETRDYQGGPT